jgi:hypothetical protein
MLGRRPAAVPQPVAEPVGVRSTSASASEPMASPGA